MWLGSKWNEKFFPAIDTAIALNELNHLPHAGTGISAVRSRNASEGMLSGGRVLKSKI